MSAAHWGGKAWEIWVCLMVSHMSSIPPGGKLGWKKVKCTPRATVLGIFEVQGYAEHDLEFIVPRQVDNYLRTQVTHLLFFPQLQWLFSGPTRVMSPLQTVILNSWRWGYTTFPRRECMEIQGWQSLYLKYLFPTTWAPHHAKSLDVRSLWGVVIATKDGLIPDQMK